MVPRSSPIHTATRPDLRRFAWLSIAAAIITIGLKSGAYLLTGSVGLLSDAAESVVNLVAAIVALIALGVAAQPFDEKHHFGHSKAEYFSAAIEGIMIFVAAGFILWTSVERFLNPEPLENVGIGLVISVVASAINGVVAVALGRAGRGVLGLGGVPALDHGAGRCVVGLVDHQPHQARSRQLADGALQKLAVQPRCQALLPEQVLQHVRLDGAGRFVDGLHGALLPRRTGPVTLLRAWRGRWPGPRPRCLRTAA